MNEVDWVILAVLALSTIVGVSRGLVREILAIVGWVLAILLALKFAPMVGEAIPLPSLSILVRTALGAVLVVVATLLVIGMAGKIFAHLMAAASITFEDRAIGAVFGLVRGVVIVCACVFVLGLTLPVEEHVRALFYFVACAVSGYDIFLSAVSNIFRGRLLDERFLMSAATIGAFVLGEFGEGAAVMLF